MALARSAVSLEHIVSIVRGRRAVLARRRKNAKRAPRALEPRAIMLEYTKALVEVVKDIREAVDEIIVPVLPVADALAPVPTRQDASDDEIDRASKRLKETVRLRTQAPALRNRVLRVGEQTSSHQKEQFKKQIRSVLKVEPLVQDSFLADQMGLFVRQQMGFIEEIGEEAVNKTTSFVLRSVRQGVRAETMKQDLAKLLDVSERRAEFIARDQVLKFHGELNQLRQTEAGVTEYEWSTSNDERVRGQKPGDSQDHYSLDGQIFKWSEPPVTGKDGHRAHPGEDPNCRCQAIPVIKF